MTDKDSDPRHTLDNFVEPVINLLRHMATGLLLLIVSKSR